MRYLSRDDFSHAQRRRIGVLLVNLGTPDAPSTSAVRRYLAEFLSDPRVVETPRWLWWLILHGIILRIRPARSARAYQKVWTADGSPLLHNARAQCEALAKRLEAEHPGMFDVALAMRYQSPDLARTLRAQLARGVDRLLVLPLYPQYSATTTGSVFDAVADALKQQRWLPALRMLDAYHETPGYIEAVASSVRDHWQRNGQAQRLLFSFHGLPRRYLDMGDPYHCQCHATARRVAAALELEQARWHVSFQSRVGREEWLRPYTDETLREWGGQGLGSVDVVCPGFSADCLETIEEIDQENREIFTDAGGGTFSYIPALNDRPDHIQTLATIVSSNTSDWLPWGLLEKANDDERGRRRSARARAMGARV
jgi:ferrochelatase